MNTEELKIYLRTVADTTGAKQTQQALRGVADPGGFCRRHRRRLCGAPCGRRLRQLPGRFDYRAARAPAAMRGTSAAYATMATRITNLDAAFARADKSGHEFQIMIGRIAAPAVLTGIMGIGRAIEGVTGLLKDASKAAVDLAKNPLPGAASRPAADRWVGASIGAVYGAAGAVAVCKRRSVSPLAAGRNSRCAGYGKSTSCRAPTMAQEAGATRLLGSDRCRRPRGHATPATPDRAAARRRRSSVPGSPGTPVTVAGAGKDARAATSDDRAADPRSAGGDAGYRSTRGSALPATPRRAHQP